MKRTIQWSGMSLPLYEKSQINIKLCRAATASAPGAARRERCAPAKFSALKPKNVPVPN
jgi:hypothetical protein